MYTTVSFLCECLEILCQKFIVRYKCKCKTFMDYNNWNILNSRVCISCNSLPELQIRLLENGRECKCSKTTILDVLTLDAKLAGYSSHSGICDFEDAISDCLQNAVLYYIDKKERQSQEIRAIIQKRNNLLIHCCEDCKSFLKDIYNQHFFFLFKELDIDNL